MMLPAHIVLAVISLCFATYAAFVPSRKKLRIVYLLAGATAISGIAAGLEKQVNLAHACISGAFYLGLIIVSISVARNKLRFTI